MTTQRYTTALIDLDGTLIDTLADLAAAANAMRVELGLEPLPRALIGTYIGKGAAMLVERSLAGSEGRPVTQAWLQHGIAVFRRHYLALNGREAVLYPGVHEGLQALRAMGMRLGIVTNKLAQFTAPLLEQTGLSDYFSCVVCGDTCTRAKPDPTPLLHACTLLQAVPRQTVMIGDSINDTLAARAAGTTVLAVSYGYNEGQDVYTLDADAVVSSIADAAQWVAQQQPFGS